MKPPVDFNDNPIKADTYAVRAKINYRSPELEKVYILDIMQEQDSRRPEKYTTKIRIKGENTSRTSIISARGNKFVELIVPKE